MKITLINPLCRLPYALPLGLGYIASVARQDGHRLEILDINAFGYSEKEVADKIKALDADIVGIGGLTSTYRYVKWLAAEIKKARPELTVVAGNMVSTASPELLLKHSAVDIAVIDEGERTFKELIAALQARRSLSEVKGIAYRTPEGVIARTSPQNRITDLDSLPFPAWDLFPMEIYLNNSTQNSGGFGLRQTNISSVRGCPYECTFCSHPFGRKTYTRSPANIISEIRELQNKYKVRFISFSDDLFLVDQRRVMEFCEKLLMENIDIKWSAAARVNLVNEKLLKAMQRAGCVELGYGFESGSQIILDKLKKRVTVRQAEDAVRATRCAGINITGSFIIGMPGETQGTINETMEFIKRNDLPLYRFFYATPYPDTELYEIARSTGRLPKDEDKYLESLGEMRTTFLVNLTDLSDRELVRLKNSAEIETKKNLSFRIKLGMFIEDWHRRFIRFVKSVRSDGMAQALAAIALKIRQKLEKI